MVKDKWKSTKDCFVGMTIPIFCQNQYCIGSMSSKLWIRTVYWWFVCCKCFCEFGPPCPYSCVMLWIGLDPKTSGKITYKSQWGNWWISWEDLLAHLRVSQVSWESPRKEYPTLPKKHLTSFQDNLFRSLRLDVLPLQWIQLIRILSKDFTSTFNHNECLLPRIYLHLSIECIQVRGCLAPSSNY